MYNEEDFEGEEDEIINEEYKFWKYNSRYLYDILLIVAFIKSIISSINNRRFKFKNIQNSFRNTYYIK